MAREASAAGAASRLRTRTAGLAVVAALAVAVGLTGCSAGDNTVAAQARQGGQTGFVAGDGSYEVIPAARRQGPVSLSGTTLAGASWAVADAAGSVVVLNVWGSWCAPCVTEMPLLQSVWTTLSAAKAPVVFMGVNLGDGAATGAAAARSFGLTYPSLSDPDRAMPSQLQGKANATPTTLVLDRQGRIAARFSGAITSAATLRDVITEVVAERA